MNLHTAHGIFFGFCLGVNMRLFGITEYCTYESLLNLKLCHLSGSAYILICKMVGAIGRK